MIRGGMAVTVEGWEGIAFRVRKAQGTRAKVVMVGDDRVHDVPRDSCRLLRRSNYCGICGQIGCTHDDRSWGIAAPGAA